MARLPTGTVTFLFADIRGSTRLLERLQDRYADVLDTYRDLVRRIVREHDGHEVDTEGDSFFIGFPRAKDAVAAAVAVQRAISSHMWPDAVPVQVRIGLHTGEPLHTDAGYVGLDVHPAARICAAGHGGQILLSQTTRDLVEADLPEGVTLRSLGTYRLKDLTHPQPLYEVVAADLPVEFPPLRSLETLPNNLPVQITSFVGREREMAEIKRLLSLHRLVTLTGAGGSGKTRLALQVAADLLDAFPDGTWLADLSSLADPTLVPQVAASILRVREETGRTLTETLAGALRDKSLLLLLDNCEHLVTACAQLSHALLEAAPGLRILATSREALAVPGENIRIVPQLAVPALQPAFDPAALRNNDAVKLFIDRATSVQPGFTLTAANARAVVDICRQLDGIPLAIELAAARTSVLTVEQIAARLTDRFRLLTGSGRAAQPRHRTLRETFAWSYGLLSAHEQALFRRMAVFAGGCALDAVEHICAGDPVAATDVLDVLSQLVNKSLLLADVTGDEARYRMLDTVQQYAHEKFDAADERALVRARHRDWFLELAERSEPALRGSHQEAWVERLTLELDNLRAALEWCRRMAGDPEVGLRIAGALGMFWDVRGFLREGLQWLEEFLTKATGAPAPVRARALNWAATLAYRQGDYARVRTVSTQALELGRASGDRWNSALALHYLGHMAQVDGDFDSAARLLEESVDLFRDDGDRWGLAYSLNCLADVARNRGTLDRAAALFDEAVAIWRAIRNTWGLALSLHNLGHVILRGGDPQKAGELFAESVAYMRTLGSKFMAYAVAGLAAAAAGAGKLQQAARLFGSADSMLAQAGLRLEPADRADFDRNLAKVRAGLHETIFAEAWNAGQAMPIDEVIDHALVTFKPSGVPLRATRAARRGPLTPREQEVAGLVARGLTNHEIASALVIAERTAETHVQNIMNKLGFNSRSQIAAWSVEHGLHSATG